MKKIATRSLTVILMAMAFFAMILLPKMDASADTSDYYITPIKEVVESSVDDVSYVHYLYSPSADYTKVEAYIKAPNGQDGTATMYSYGKKDFCFFKAELLITGTYTVKFTEYKKNSSDTWVKTGITANAKIIVSAKKTGWSKTNGVYCYYNSNGVRQYEWQKIGGKWYYLDPFFGGITTGWMSQDGKWYHFNSNGVADTGWKKIDGTWYHFTGGCVMDTGWKKIDGEWYYFDVNGEMSTRWMQINGKWYFFGNDGKMRKGWEQISGKWYYFVNGVVTTSWRKIDNKWYYFNKDGIMQVGWQRIDKKWYYLKNGVMLTGKQTIDGKKYTFNEYGELQQ